MAKWKVWKDYMLIVIGTGIMAVSINSVFDPLDMVTGGFSGLAIMIKHLSGTVIPGGIPLWLTTLVLNVPLFVIGIKVKGIRFLKRSLVGTLSLSVWLSVLPAFSLVSGDYLLAALYGGAIQGVGIGLAFTGQGTTGGSDMTAALLQMKFRHYSVSQVLQFVDGFIVIMGGLVFGITKVLYAIIAIFVISKVSDGIMEGPKFSKAVFIITQQYEQIAAVLNQELKRGVSNISIRGMYSGGEKNMLFCVVAKKQIVSLKEMVNHLDPVAFVVVTDVREVLGEGFIEHPKMEK